MIFGSGLIANKLIESNLFEEYNVIAKGVSDSKAKNLSIYRRQEEEILNCIGLIKENYFDKRTVYISSVIPNLDSIYFREKVEIEYLLRREFSDLLIVRLTNAVGLVQNPNNIFKFFCDKITSNEVIDININAVRNVIDVVDIVNILHEILFSCDANEIEIGFSENISALRLAQIIQNYYGRTDLIVTHNGNYDFVGIDVNSAQYIENYFRNSFDDVNSYIVHLLSKYGKSL